jgi:hypothetical protein
MKIWILKAVVQKFISFLPYSSKINFFFQKYVTKGVYLSDFYFYDRLFHGKNHILGYKKFFDNQVPYVCLEIGTGWYPTVPIAFFLIGAKKIYSLDISFLTSKERLKVTIEKFLESNEKGKLEDYITAKPERINILKELIQNYEKYNLEELLHSLNIEYLIGDARNIMLEENSIDLITSNNTFEHIYPEILIPILKEFRRILKNDSGLMSHFIDMTDHFAHLDKTISVYNFLKFSNFAWRIIDNSVQPQNRLRINDFKTIYNGLNIPIDEETIDEGDLEVLKNIQINNLYNNEKLSDLAVTHCHFYSVITEDI